MDICSSRYPLAVHCNLLHFPVCVHATDQNSLILNYLYFSLSFHPFFLLWTRAYGHISSCANQLQIKPLYIRIPAMVFFTLVVSWANLYAVLSAGIIFLTKRPYTPTYHMISQVIIDIVIIQSAVFTRSFTFTEQERDLTWWKVRERKTWKKSAGAARCIWRANRTRILSSIRFNTFLTWSTRTRWNANYSIYTGESVRYIVMNKKRPDTAEKRAIRQQLFYLLKNRSSPGGFEHVEQNG